MIFLKKTILIICTIFLLTNCTSTKTPYTNRTQLIFMSSQEEILLGEKTYKEILSSNKVLKNTPESLKIKLIGNKIAKVANIPQYNWEFNLIDNKQINAFCLPGGKVIFYTGILNLTENDDQIATVMGHEIAHALARHGAERIAASQLQQTVGVIGQIIIKTTRPEYENLYKQAYSTGTSLGIMLPYSRLQENEADEIGLYLLYKAGYNPKEALKFWDKMLKISKSSTTPEFLSTHPSTNNRIENIKEIILKNNW